MIPVKTEEDLKHIRRACQIAAKVLEKVKAKIKEGISTRELDQIAEELILEEGAIPAFKGYRGYKFSSCISVNEEVVHGLPSERKLKSGDIVGIDIGTQLRGYFGDTAATLPVGKVSKEVEKLLEIAEEALGRAIKQAKPGRRLGEISYAIQSHAEANGFSVVRDLFGHGIGKALHEEPLIPNFGEKGQGPELKPGMVLAIEPMLNMGTFEIKTLEDGWTVVTKDGRPSAHFEHTILITEGEPEILTKYA